jgi:hypothetical protein
VRSRFFPSLLGDASQEGPPDKLTQGECDSYIALLFGGDGAIAATAIEPFKISSKSTVVKNGKLQYENTVINETRDYSVHLSDNGTFHLYPDFGGSGTAEVGLFLPPGAIVEKLVGERQQEGNTGLTNTFAFSYSSGPLKGMEIWFDHVGGTYGGLEGGQHLGKEFLRADRGGKYSLIGPKNAMGSQQIGLIGGVGGIQDPNIYTNPKYRHTHVTVKRNGKRIDPRSAFCGW